MFHLATQLYMFPTVGKIEDTKTNLIRVAAVEATTAMIEITDAAEAVTHMQGKIVGMTMTMAIQGAEAVTHMQDAAEVKTGWQTAGCVLKK